MKIWIRGQLNLMAIFILLLHPASLSISSAEEIPMTIDGQINCAHPDNAITTTCRGEAPPPPAPTPSVVTEAPPPAASTPSVTTEAPAPGTTITYSGNEAINCGLPENKDNNICLPMTHSDGTINCAQADNAITTTCWERAQTLKQMGAIETEVDCSLDRFKEYPVCTGIKPQAVIEYEKSKEVASTLPSSNTRCSEPAFINSEDCKNFEAANSEDNEKTTNPIEPEVKPEITGSIDLKSRNSKLTVLKVNLDASKVQVKIIATKKGATSITREITTDASGNKTVKFDKNLKGYTVKIVVNGETINQTKI